MTSDAPLPGAPLDPRRRRLLFRASHRGTHENDIMIGGFVRPRLAGFSAEELDGLEALLELPDTVLADWLSGRIAVPAELATPMLAAICAAVAAGEAVRLPGDVA